MYPKAFSIAKTNAATFLTLRKEWKPHRVSGCTLTMCQITESIASCRLTPVSDRSTDKKGSDRKGELLFSFLRPTNEALRLDFNCLARGRGVQLSTYRDSISELSRAADPTFQLFSGGNQTHHPVRKLMTVHPRAIHSSRRRLPTGSGFLRTCSWG